MLTSTSCAPARSIAQHASRKERRASALNSGPDAWLLMTPRRSRFGAAARTLRGSAVIAPRSKPASRAVRAIGPTWSRDHDSGNTPVVETRPYVGFSPTQPQYDAGTLIEPPVSEPTAP